MKRTPISVDFSTIPSQFHPYLQDAALFDSSCSSAAQVYFLDKGPGFYLKTAAKGTLAKEAAMNSFFHCKGLGPEVLAYESLDADWMLTLRIPGEDCIHPQYIADPTRLCDTTAQLLRMLHDTDFTGCPVPNRTAQHLAAARHNHENKLYDTSLFPDNWGYDTPEAAWAEIEKNAGFLRNDTLLHGDYCLPNIMLDNWNFSAFIDLDAGGVGDKHVDLFWGMWSLQFNLKTDQYRNRFLDVYGREHICEDAFRTIAAIEVFA